MMRARSTSVVLIYTSFINTLEQEVKNVLLLPLGEGEEESV
ncbi:MAG: hypothetical protein V8R14_03790 [Clostridia bacterium]